MISLYSKSLQRIGTYTMHNETQQGEKGAIRGPQLVFAQGLTNS